MIPLLAQAESGPDPDLTRPTLVIAACAVVIIVTVLLQVVRARRQGDEPGVDDGAGATGGGDGPQ